jgi:minor extracellular serine protease Vpr
MKWLFFIAQFMVASTVMGQHARPAVVPLSLEWAMRQQPDASEAHLFIKGPIDSIDQFLTAHDGVLKYTFKGYAAVRMHPQDVGILNNLPWVEHVHFEHAPGQPLLYQSRLHTGVNKIHNGTANLPSIYKGSGVIVGVIDAGIELLHPDFRDANGKTRIIELWDQTMPIDAQHTPSYGYGQVWDSTEINDSICPHQDQSVWYGHGTNTAGIVAGNGISNSIYTGMAPQSELIIVSSNFNAIGWTNTVADAVNYIFQKAE